MPKNKYDALILAGIGRSITASEQPPVRRQQSGAVRIDYREWLGKETTFSERACLSRALLSLERRGYVVRLPGKCVALTLEGMRYLYDLETVELPNTTGRKPLENGIGTPTSGSPHLPAKMLACYLPTVRDRWFVVTGKERFFHPLLFIFTTRCVFENVQKKLDPMLFF
ncbi:MAG: hypothetical protein ABIH86_01200 [Planctomycetota bacterium]